VKNVARIDAWLSGLKPPILAPVARSQTQSSPFPWSSTVRESPCMLTDWTADTQLPFPADLPAIRSLTRTQQFGPLAAGDNFGHDSRARVHGCGGRRAVALLENDCLAKNVPLVRLLRSA